MAAQFSNPFGPYIGFVIGAAALGAVLVLNQVIYRWQWKAYPTLARYLAAHPECDKPQSVVCDHCGTGAAGMGVSGRGRIYRCTWCETELYRVDRDAGGDGV